jgi:hypothetical protein
MNLKLSVAALLLGCLALAGRAVADCPGPFVNDAKRSYEGGQSYEKQGKIEQALFSYHAAEGSVCEGANPYEADAAKRAAPLGLSLGAAAEKAGDLAKAKELYEAGGHYALADRVFMQTVRANADSPGMFQTARSHFETRGAEFFYVNNAAALKATGAYKPDPKYIAEVMAMPAKGAERAAQNEIAAFKEQYLRDYVQLIQTRADDPTDASAVQRTISSHQAFAQKWQEQDPMKDSRKALELMRDWGRNNGGNEALQKLMETQVKQRAEQHAQLLPQKYSGAPKLLEDASDFIHLLDLERAKEEARVTAVRAQAMKLGDDANAKQRYTLAADYYQVAGDSAKAQATRTKQNQLAMQKMQPSIDAAKRQAEELQKQFSDPAKVQAMREQAEAARRSLQQQQAASKQANKKSAAELEKELGL